MELPVVLDLGACEVNLELHLDLHHGRRREGRSFLLGNRPLDSILSQWPHLTSSFSFLVLVIGICSNGAGPQFDIGLLVLDRALSPLSLYHLSIISYWFYLGTQI